MPFLAVLREKIPITAIAIVVVYSLVAAVIFLNCWPTYREVHKLQDNIAQAQALEQVLSSKVEKRPSLEMQQIELAKSLALLAQQVPTQLDIPLVVELLRDMAKGPNLQLKRLDYQPLRYDNSHARFAFNMVVEGDSSVFGLTETLFQALPSLKMQNLQLESTPEGRLRLSMAASLSVMTVEGRHEPLWQKPVPAITSPGKVTGFSVPFSVVEAFYSGKYRVLGVVRTDKQRYALLSADGAEKWVRVGDVINQGRVTRIDSTGVVLDLAGVKVELNIGS